MKKNLLFILFLSLQLVAGSQTRDVPTPTTNLQNIPVGSYVIAMDNILQMNAAGHFNLKTYGLIIHLLNNGAKIKWSIRSGKTKDATDFTATTQQFQPALVGAAVSRSFRAGPFVIFAADTTGIAAMINAYYTAQSLTGNDRPKVYRTTAAVANVDIRYDLSNFRPKANILTDGGNASIHVGYMTNCGITTANYRLGPATDLLTKCFTFASEPHNDNASSNTMYAIKQFVNYGGNFLAQCAAVETYENSINGRFQTTGGISVLNSSVSSASVIYPNADLAYSQFEGIFDIRYGGSVRNWTLGVGSTYKNHGHNHATGSGLLYSVVGASVAKMNGTVLAGGLVFYLGNHDFNSTTAIESINGIRMYMNAFLTPSAINQICTIGGALPNPLPVKLTSFNANLDKATATVNLSWTTASEINLSHFVVERSFDRISYISVGQVMANGNTIEKSNYQLTDYIAGPNEKMVYYRLRSIDQDGKAEYSEIRSVKLNANVSEELTVTAFPNPVVSELHITIPVEWQNKLVRYELINANGHTVTIKTITYSKFVESIQLHSVSKGFYLLRITCDGQSLTQRIIKI